MLNCDASGVQLWR